MTFIVDGSNGLTFPNSTTQASAGSVLQVVQSTYSTATNTSSTTLTDTGLSATITPKFSTSKILVLFCHWENYINGSAKAIGIALLRNSTVLGNFQTATLGYIGTGGDNYPNINGQYLDSPATTSAVTYKTQFKSHYSTNVGVQGDSTTSYITLMEIAA